MEQQTKNNHIVSRCLTRPWEYGERRLRYFDFGPDSFGDQSSKSLFAKTGIFTSEEETTFNGLFEDPFTRLRDRIQTAEKLDLTVRERLSLYLMILLGSTRFALANFPGFGEGRPSFATLLKCSEEELESIHHKLTDRFTLVRLPVPADHRLFVPETGIFPIPTFDPEAPYATAIPITPRWMVAMAPPSAKDSLLNNYHGQERYLTQCSVGLYPPVKRIVVAPDLYDEVGEDELRKRILLMRSGNHELKKMFGWLLGLEL